MSRTILVVQHGEKERLPGDPGLTALGHTQAEATAAWLVEAVAPLAVWSSPHRRALQTAAPIVARTCVDLKIDTRLRERMNWDGASGETGEEFLKDWHLASVDRSHTPRSGDSSNAAASRFLDALADLAATFDDGVAIAVAHGGVTTDVLRTLLGDERVNTNAPSLIEHGVASCAITTLRLDVEQWCVDSLPTTTHLTEASARHMT